MIFVARVLINAVEIADNLYWSMLELSIALIAACLPTLHHLSRSISPALVLSVLRSKFSNQSLRSQRSEHFRLEEHQPGSLGDEEIGTRYMNRTDIKAHAVNEDAFVRGHGGLAPGSKSGIMVQKDLSSYESNLER